MPPFVSDVFVDMYCIMSRSSTTEDLHIRNASGLVPLCTHGGDACGYICVRRVSSSNSIPDNQVFGDS